MPITKRFNEQIPPEDFEDFCPENYELNLPDLSAGAETRKIRKGTKARESNGFSKVIRDLQKKIKSFFAGA